MIKTNGQKICVVTGGTSGIGYETVRALARKGATVVLIGRNPKKTDQVAESVAKDTENPNISTVVADLSSQQQIRSAADIIRARHREVDVLVNNAGIWLSKYTETEDGVETMFAVNHLSYFLLSHLLLPSLSASGSGRIVNVGSDSHFQGRIHLDDPNLKARYHGLRAYAQSKLANVLFTYELDRQLRQHKLPVTVNCVQPGLVKTDIGVKHTISLHALAWKIRRMGGVTPGEGAKTSVFLATSAEVEGVSGKYWDQCKSKKSSRRSYDLVMAKSLWDRSLQMCGISHYLEETSV